MEYWQVQAASWETWRRQVTQAAHVEAYHGRTLVAKENAGIIVVRTSAALSTSEPTAAAIVISIGPRKSGGALLCSAREGAPSRQHAPRPMDIVAFQRAPRIPEELYSATQRDRGTELLAVCFASAISKR
jgi:hypothetical protein